MSIDVAGAKIVVPDAIAEHVAGGDGEDGPPAEPRQIGNPDGWFTSVVPPGTLRTWAVISDNCSFRPATAVSPGL